MKEKNTDKQEKLQIFFPVKTIKLLEEIGYAMGIKRTDVVKIAVNKYVDDYMRKNKSNK